MTEREREEVRETGKTENARQRKRQRDRQLEFVHLVLETIIVILPMCAVSRQRKVKLEASEATTQKKACSSNVNRSVRGVAGNAESWYNCL